MREVFKNIRRFIEDLRAAPEGRRKRWLWISSGISMALVVSAWVLYMRVAGIVPGGAEQTEKRGARAERPPFAITVVAGAREVGGFFSERGREMFGAVQTVFGPPRDIVVESPKRDFILDSLPDIPPTALP